MRAKERMAANGSCFAQSRALMARFGCRCGFLLMSPKACLMFKAWKMALTLVMSCALACVSLASPYQLSFTSFAPLNTDIFIADGDGNNARAVISDPDLDSNASFSKDGRWIIFTSRRNGSSDIYRAHLDGAGLEVLVSDPAFDDQGALSPDGKELAFVSTRSGQADIWVLNIRTKSLRQITNRSGGNFRPAWSPDGKWLAFCRGAVQSWGGDGTAVIKLS
jgi:Tol biopolymer transport system component